jgi:hypothetical protein
MPRLCDWVVVVMFTLLVAVPQMLSRTWFRSGYFFTWDTGTLVSENNMKFYFQTILHNSWTMENTIKLHQYGNKKLLCVTNYTIQLLLRSKSFNIPKNSPKLHYSDQKSLFVDPTQPWWIKSTTLHPIFIRSNITLLSHLCLSPKWCLPFRFSNQDSVFISCIFHVCISSPLISPFLIWPSQWNLV